MDRKITAKRLEISGVVQGVGFRPFLFGLASARGLAGEVSNTARGVLARVEGTPEDLDRFVRDIREKPPLLARVEDIRETPARVKGFKAFTIIKSRGADGRATLISPDVSICPDCLAELMNPADRRYHYPFINCTNCGPRFTIIRDIPYDRPKTAMAGFEMCEDCRAEYENPADRRFHAQPNACPVCGPRVFLTDNRGNRVDAGPADALDRAAALLKQGKILAVKGLGGFHLAVDAANDRSVGLLRERKIRPHKPFALMARSVSALDGHVRVPDKARALLASFQRPIVLLEKVVPEEKNDPVAARLSPALAPNNTCLGVMFPYTPLHYLILEKGPDILVMTSGNRSGEPLSIDNQDALDAFAHIADFFLLHNRDIYFRADDSIARIQAGRRRFVRRSRGYAPLPVTLDRDLPPILGCGAHLKNTVCLTRGRHAFLSQHIGDLENPKSHAYYIQSVGHLKKILDIRPRVVAHDLHPGYMSTRYAAEYANDPDNLPDGAGPDAAALPLIPVQHHHAHAVACMAENHLDEPVIALTLDGTGYGSDGHIWGGEVLVCTRGTFVRKAQLSYLPMPGGDKAVLEPWRMAAAVLYKTFGPAFTDLPIPWNREMETEKLTFLRQMMDRGINCPLTSSCGRLFDAVSSLLCIRHIISHESQAAMELEARAVGSPSGPELAPYPVSLLERQIDGIGPYLEMDIRPCIREIVGDIRAGTGTAGISRRFHLALVSGFARAVGKTALETGINKVVLSGGVFNNDVMLAGMIQHLEAEGLTVFTHSRVPAGDGGICLGQVAAAAARIGAASKGKERQ